MTILDYTITKKSQEDIGVEKREQIFENIELSEFNKILKCSLKIDSLIINIFYIYLLYMNFQRIWKHVTNNPHFVFGGLIALANVSRIPAATKSLSRDLKIERYNILVARSCLKGIIYGTLFPYSLVPIGLSTLVSIWFCSLIPLYVYTDPKMI